MLKICFFGPSGSGKSTCYPYAREFFYNSRMNARRDVRRCDVAQPLREIQTQVYSQLGLPSPGDSRLPETFQQDGKLLSFLSEHYQNSLRSLTENRLKLLEQQGHPFETVIINTDCRNNMYSIFKDHGFKFIKVEVKPETLTQRRLQRGDLTLFDYSVAVEQLDQIIPDFVITNDDSLESLKQKICQTLTLVLDNS